MSDTSGLVIRKLVALPLDLVAAIDEFRFSHRLRTETETIRVLIRAGLGNGKSSAPTPTLAAVPEDQSPDLVAAVVADDDVLPQPLPPEAWGRKKR